MYLCMYVFLRKMESFNCPRLNGKKRLMMECPNVDSDAFVMRNEKDVLHDVLKEASPFPSNIIANLEENYM